METRYRRASATAEELEERRREANGHAYTTTSSTARRQPTTRDDRQIGVIGKSAIRHRPINVEYVIPLTDGTEMHVTERELSDLPKEYRQAAILVTSPPQKRQALPESHTDDLPEPAPRHRRFRFHWLFWVGIALFIMIFGWIALSTLGTWVTNAHNQLTYGYPRTFQTDYNVGHGTAADPNSHFIAINLNKQIEVIEFPGDDPAKSKIYIGPTLIGQGQELTPVTLSFEDVNNDGKPDLVIHVADSKFVFLNTGTGFKPAPNQ